MKLKLKKLNLTKKSSLKLKSKASKELKELKGSVSKDHDNIMEFGDKRISDEVYHAVNFDPQMKQYYSSSMIKGMTKGSLLKPVTSSTELGKAIHTLTEWIFRGEKYQIHDKGAMEAEKKKEIKGLTEKYKAEKIKTAKAEGIKLTATEATKEAKAEALTEVEDKYQKLYGKGNVMVATPEDAKLRIKCASNIEKLKEFLVTSDDKIYPNNIENSLFTPFAKIESFNAQDIPECIRPLHQVMLKLRQGLKTRMDYYVNSASEFNLYEIKTTSKLNINELLRQAKFTYSYHISTAIYLLNACYHGLIHASMEGPSIRVNFMYMIKNKTSSSPVYVSIYPNNEEAFIRDVLKFSVDFISNYQEYVETRKSVETEAIVFKKFYSTQEHLRASEEIEELKDKLITEKEV